MDGVPSGVATASYQTRIIVRDVTGKYTWDCTVLYGPEPHPSTSGEYLLRKSHTVETFSVRFHRLPGCPSFQSAALKAGNGLGTSLVQKFNVVLIIAIA